MGLVQELLGALDDEALERAGEAIWKFQVSKLHADAINRRREWRSKDIPDRFWEGMKDDAGVAICSFLDYLENKEDS